MSVISNFLTILAELVDIGLTLYVYVIIARVIVSWVNADPYNPIVRFLYSVTEPVLSAVRRRLPVSYGGFDFSPWIVILGFALLEAFLVQMLYQLAAGPA